MIVFVSAPCKRRKFIQVADTLNAMCCDTLSTNYLFNMAGVLLEPGGRLFPFTDAQSVQ